MQNSLIKTIVIVGGGTAGWMTATALSTVLRGRYTIRLVESDEIGIVGVGEATIPMISIFNKIAGIDENDFIRNTNGTFKLGIEFVNWGRLGDRYMHGFGKIGQDLWTVRFDQYWHKMHQTRKVDDLAPYSITRMASRVNKFMPASNEYENSPLNDIRHAYQFDANLYAKYLSKLAQQRGVQRTEGKISRATQREGDGHIDAVVLESGERIEGDLFIDCSGFRGLLIEQTLKTGYEDWTHWLPCDRALAVPCESSPKLLPYTRATAHKAGWQWRIPLQHRIGNGHVYCCRHTSDDEATATLLSNLDGKPLADPRPIRFVTGRRKKAWNKNVIAIGLSSGFMEPLESTSIHMIQSSIQRLIDYFPDQAFSETDVDEFNRQSKYEYESIRDFIILHYKLNQRDEPFWKECANMAIPDTLKHKMDLYQSRGRLIRIDNELFTEDSWLQVLQGQNMFPDTYHPLVDLQDEKSVAEYLESVREVISKCVDVMPTHEQYIAKNCMAKKINS
jgi:tryptophan 7-halogenase